MSDVIATAANIFARAKVQLTEQDDPHVYWSNWTKDMHNLPDIGLQQLHHDLDIEIGDRGNTHFTADGEAVTKQMKVVKIRVALAMKSRRISPFHKRRGKYCLKHAV